MKFNTPQDHINHLRNDKDDAIRAANYPLAAAIRDHMQTIEEHEMPMKTITVPDNLKPYEGLCKTVTVPGFTLPKSGSKFFPPRTVTGPKTNEAETTDIPRWHVASVLVIEDNEPMTEDDYQNADIVINKSGKLCKSRYTNTTPSLDGLTASEALYGFMAWLTTRDKVETFSAHHNAGPAAELISAFCKEQNLQDPSETWTDNIVPMPKDKYCLPQSPDPVQTVDMSYAVFQREDPLPAHPDNLLSSPDVHLSDYWRARILGVCEHVQKLLSRDLSYANRGIAKETVQKLWLDATEYNCHPDAIEGEKSFSKIGGTNAD